MWFLPLLQRKIWSLLKANAALLNDVYEYLLLWTRRWALQLSHRLLCLPSFMHIFIRIYTIHASAPHYIDPGRSTFAPFLSSPTPPIQLCLFSLSPQEWLKDWYIQKQRERRRKGGNPARSVEHNTQIHIDPFGWLEALGGSRNSRTTLLYVYNELFFLSQSSFYIFVERRKKAIYLFCVILLRYIVNNVSRGLSRFYGRFLWLRQLAPSRVCVYISPRIKCSVKGRYVRAWQWSHRCVGISPVSRPIDLRSTVALPIYSPFSFFKRGEDDHRQSSYVMYTLRRANKLLCCPPRSLQLNIVLSPPVIVIVDPDSDVIRLGFPTRKI